MAGGIGYVVVLSRGRLTAQVNAEARPQTSDVLRPCRVTPTDVAGRVWYLS